MHAPMLAHHRRGEGDQVVVALHGFLGSARNLGAMVRTWTQRDPSIQVIAMDLLGHGQSPPMPAKPTAEALADAVLTTMDELGVQSARFVGHSLGGRISLLCRARAPERAPRIDLLDITPGPIPVTDTDRVVEALETAPDAVEDRAAVVDHLRAHGLAEGLVEWLAMNLARRDDGRLGWRIDRARLAAYHHGTRGQSLWPVVESHPSGLRVAKGARSSFLSAEDIARFARLGVEVRSFDGAGHFVHVDATGDVVDWLQALTVR